ncbi:hypothetical protein L1887_57339 [Cichorium endivia]|nr:hypothetical protein L1887_57339 [Cichorium endivia]
MVVAAEDATRDDGSSFAQAAAAAAAAARAARRETSLGCVATLGALGAAGEGKSVGLATIQLEPARARVRAIGGEDKASLSNSLSQRQASHTRARPTQPSPAHAPRSLSRLANFEAGPPGLGCRRGRLKCCSFSPPSHPRAAHSRQPFEFTSMAKIERIPRSCTCACARNFVLPPARCLCDQTTLSETRGPSRRCSCRDRSRSRWLRVGGSDIERDKSGQRLRTAIVILEGEICVSFVLDFQSSSPQPSLTRRAFRGAGANYVPVQSAMTL